MGPLLFLIYINDLVRVKISGRFTLFADDTSIVWHNGSTLQLREDISRDLSAVVAWCDSNRLSFNINKTNIVGFGCDMQGLYMENVPLQENSVNKFLGIMVDGKLRFEDHILSMSKKLSSACFAIKTASKELSPLVGRTVYFALFEPYLRYGIPFWGVASQYLLNVVLILQKRAVRFIAGISQRESCRPHFVSQRIMTLTSLFVLETATLIYKNRQSLQRDNSTLRTRQSHNLPLPIPTRALTKNSIIFEGIKLYNHLPVSIRNNTTLTHFRKSLKELLVGKAYYKLSEFYEDTLR